MSKRWQHKVIEITYQMFGNTTTERAQAELDTMSAQGWELVSTAQHGPLSGDSVRMFFKKEV